MVHGYKIYPGVTTAMLGIPRLLENKLADTGEKKIQSTNAATFR